MNTLGHWEAATCICPCFQKFLLISKYKNLQKHTQRKSDHSGTTSGVNVLELCMGHKRLGPRLQYNGSNCK